MATKPPTSQCMINVNESEIVHPKDEHPKGNQISQSENDSFFPLATIGPISALWWRTGPLWVDFFRLCDTQAEIGKIWGFP